MNTLFGIPLSKKNLSDDEFIEKIKLNILKRRKIRIIWPILTIIIILFLLLYMIMFISPSTNNPPLLNELKWLGFWSGFIFGAFCFTVVMSSIIVIISWREGFEINRKEKLLLKCYDELTKLKKM